MCTERIWCGDRWQITTPLVEPGGERSYRRKESSLQSLASEHSWTFFAFAVRWGTKVRKSSGKESKIQFWENFGHILSLRYWQVNELFWTTIWSLRDKGLILIAPSKNKTVFYSAMRETSFANERLFQKSFEPSYYHNIRCARGAIGEEIYNHYSRRLPSCLNTESWRSSRLWWNLTCNTQALNTERVLWLTLVCLVAWHSGRTLEDWQTRAIISIHKKRDRKQRKNYRDISPLSLPGKIYAKCLVKRK